MRVVKHGCAYGAEENPQSHFCKCERCGCEVEFTCNDLLYAGMEYYLERTRAIFCLICPECNTVIYSTYSEMRVRE